MQYRETETREPTQRAVLTLQLNDPQRRECIESDWLHIVALVFLHHPSCRLVVGPVFHGRFLQPHGPTM